MFKLLQLHRRKLPKFVIYHLPSYCSVWSDESHTTCATCASFGPNLPKIPLVKRRHFSFKFFYIEKRRWTKNCQKKKKKNKNLNSTSSSSSSRTAMHSCACFTRPFISQSLADTTGSPYRSAWATLFTCAELFLGRSYTSMCVWQRESFARIFKAIADQLDVVFVGDRYVSGVERVGKITRWL